MTDATQQSSDTPPDHLSNDPRSKFHDPAVLESLEIVQRLMNRAATEGRSDDTEDVIRRRQQIYAEETAPLVEVYRERGLLVAVDGLGDVDEVTGRLVTALDAER